MTFVVHQQSILVVFKEKITEGTFNFLLTNSRLIILLMLFYFYVGVEK